MEKVYLLIWLSKFAQQGVRQEEVPRREWEHTDLMPSSHQAYPTAKLHIEVDPKLKQYRHKSLAAFTEEDKTHSDSKELCSTVN